MRKYLDANVLVSLIREEIGAHYRLLSQSVEDFLERAAEKQTTLIISDWCIDEVKKVAGVGKETIEELLTDNKLEFVSIGTAEINYALELSRTIKIPYGDARHVAIALSAKADSIVTFNLKDFEKAKHLIKIELPEDA